MSEFDKEAEREKLREKYADDADDRAATQRMSQLLLQGATMTNRHCEECGDPRFRYQGREFCPSCEGIEGGTPVDAGGETGAGQGGPAETEEATEQPTESAGATNRQPTDETRAPEGTGPSTAQQPAARRQPGGQHGHGALDEDPAPGTPDGQSGSDGRPIDGDLAEARRTLARSVRSLAERGATAEDPRRAREHLEAAREAAEALAALNR
jgi:uncharacterized Zn finger protein (UPF0148 family)